MQEDVLLVQQALSGDKLAFCRLIQKYYKSVYAQILSLVHNPDDTEELADDVFIKAYFNLSDLRQPAKFHTWLHHIAWNHSRNWLRQHDNNCLPLDDVYDETETNFVCDSAEDVLIHQEKLDKIFEAIDTLPEMDKSLMQDFYLEEIPYETLQERYKISKPAINARLIRARKRIREQLKDLFSGIMIFSWRDVLKKVLAGGVEVVKIGSKAKIIAVGIAAVLVLGGTGVILWYHHQSAQIAAESAVNQITQKASSKPSVKPVLSKKNISDEQTNKLKDEQNEDAQKAQAIAFLDSLGKDGQDKATVNGISEEKKNADSERKIWGMSVEEAHKKGAALRVDLDSWLNEAVALGDVILESAHNAAKISDPVAQEAETERSRQFSLRQIELIKKIAEWEVLYTFWAEDPDALKPGGWIYEMKMKIRPGGVIWSNPQ